MTKKTAKKPYNDHALTSVIERHGMMEAIPSTTTREMKAEFEAAGVGLPTADEIKSLSIKLNEWLEHFLHEERMPHSSTWFNLFCAIDTDHSGFITYDELRDAVRTKLHKKPSVMSDTTIKALFCSLDQDNSNELSRDEMAKFFALGYDEVHATASINDHKLTSVIERHGMSAPIASTATSDMRTELKEAGLEIPGEDEMRGLSVKFNEWVEQYRQDERLPPSTSWFNLFKEIDKDDSGFVTYDELRHTVREKLGKRPKVISDNTLKALFCALDDDDSNEVSKEEAAKFFKMGYQQNHAKPVYSDHHLTGVMERHGNAPIEATSTKEMKETFEKKGKALPSPDEMKSLSIKLNEWLELYRHDERKPASTSWSNLFNDLDADKSGFITFDELTDVVRHKLHKKKKAISDNTLKALFCALDADGNSRLTRDEMGEFFRLGYKSNHVKPVYTDQNLTGVMERHGMMEPVPSTTTKEMKAELKKKGIPLPNAEELKALSIKVNEWLEQYRADERKPHSTTWYNLFAEVDQDGSGFVTYDELWSVVRRQLNKPTKAMPDSALKALFCALDNDDDNELTKDEMAAFFKLGYKSAKAVPVYTDHALTGMIERHGMMDPIPSKSTKDMRAAFTRKGVALPNNKELKAMATKMNEWIEQYRSDERLPPSTSWYNLFTVLDKDNSGAITFDELHDAVRHRLHKKPSVISENALKAVWCALDADDSDQLTKDEMAKFFEGGMESPRQGKVGKALSRVSGMMKEINIFGASSDKVMPPSPTGSPNGSSGRVQSP